MKICNCCKEEKEYSEFPKKSSTADGYYGFCKSCKSTKDKEYREKNAGALEAKRKEKYYKDHESTLKKTRERYHNASEETKEKRKSTKVEYNKNASEEVKNNKKLYDKAYFSSEQGKLVTLRSIHKRRAQKLSTSDNSITNKALENLKISQDYKCVYCDCNLEFSSSKAVHLDHVVPLSKGGSHTLSNVVWTCASCNLKKSDKLV